MSSYFSCSLVSFVGNPVFSFLIKSHFCLLKKSRIFYFFKNENKEYLMICFTLFIYTEKARRKLIQIYTKKNPIQYLISLYFTLFISHYHFVVSFPWSYGRCCGVKLSKETYQVIVWTTNFLCLFYFFWTTYFFLRILSVGDAGWFKS